MKSATVIFALSLLLVFGCTQPEPTEPNVTETMCVPPCHITLSEYDDPEYAPTCIESAEPIACTEEYRMGDACLALIECTTEEGDCITELPPEFDECISCFRDCVKISEDSADFMVCEEMCSP